MTSPNLTDDTAPTEEYTHNDQDTLNQIKRLLFSSQTDFQDSTVVDRENQFDLSSEYQLSEQNDITTAGVTHDATESEYRIRANGSTESLESVDVFRYIPGYIAEVGTAIRIPEAPTGDQEVRWGYWDGSSGAYFGWDSDGVFVETQRDGTRQGKTYEADWNGESVADIEQQFADGMVTRLILALYNFGHVRYQLFTRDDTGRIEPKNVHRDAPTGSTTLTEQNNPIRVEVDNSSGSSDFDVFVADRQASLRGEFVPNQRLKGEQLTSVSLNGTTWTPILTLRKKSAFQGIAVNLFSMRAFADSDIIVMVRSDVGSETDSDYGTPSDLNAGETAVETDTSPSASVSDGFFRFRTLFEGGTGAQSSFGEFEDIDLEEKRQRPMTIFARTVSGTGGTINAATLNWVEQW